MAASRSPWVLNQIGKESGVGRPNLLLSTPASCLFPSLPESHGTSQGLAEGQALTAAWPQRTIGKPQTGTCRQSKSNPFIQDGNRSTWQGEVPKGL